MGTKLKPGQFDCYEKADPDEPMFVLLARDASAPALVELWAQERERHGEEAGVVAEARECAEQMRAWHDHNRRPPSPGSEEALTPVGWWAKSLRAGAIHNHPPGPRQGFSSYEHRDCVQLFAKGADG
jgi:hypothetical protein